ncbi:hypothetical protein HOD08_04645 [bacterium]|nr:hypothetical protein [bacterium]
MKVFALLCAVIFSTNLSAGLCGSKRKYIPLSQSHEMAEHNEQIAKLEKIHLTFVDSSGKNKSTGEELIVETAKKSYLSAARLFENIYRNHQNISREKAYEKFVNENPELFSDGEFYSHVRVVFATALFAAVIARNALGAQQIFGDDFPLRNMIFSMYHSLGISTLCSKIIHEPGHEPFTYGFNFGFMPLARNYEHMVLGAALDIKKRQTPVDDFMCWKNGNEFWSRPIKNLLAAQPCSG